MRVRSIAMVVMALTATCVLATGLNPPPAAAVAHGTLATAGQDPFAVKLTMTRIPQAGGTTYNSACSGTLISPTWIITAGHCFHDIQRNRVSGTTPYPTTATLNTVDLAKARGEVRTVTYVRQSGVNDVALAKLSAPVTDVRPLALRTTRPVTGELLTLAGWGATSSVNPTPSTKLSTGIVKVTSATAATLLVAGYSPAPDTSACLYDSGAPYFTTPAGVAPRLVSVESAGPDCPHVGAETTSRVDVIVPWILSIATDLPR